MPEREEKSYFNRFRNGIVKFRLQGKYHGSRKKQKSQRCDDPAEYEGACFAGIEIHQIKIAPEKGKYQQKDQPDYGRLTQVIFKGVEKLFRDLVFVTAHDFQTAVMHCGKGSAGCDNGNAHQYGKQVKDHKV